MKRAGLRCSVLVMVFMLTWILVGLSPVSAAPIELRYSTYLPPTHHLVKNIYSRWAEEVGKRTHGRVKVTLYPSGVLGKAVDHYDMALKGIADVTSTILSFTPGRHPLCTILQLPFYGDFIKGTRVVNAMFRKDLEKRFTDVKVLFVWNPPQDIGSNKPIRTLKDMTGLKIRATGSIQSKMVEALGATAVEMPITEVYTSMDRGVIDGFLLTTASWPGYKLDEVTKYGLKIGMSCPLNITLMNMKTWKSLPPDIQKIIQQIDVEAVHWLIEDYRHQEKVTDALFKKEGVEIHTLPPAELARWKQRTWPLWKQWVKAADAKGLPGKKVMGDFVQILKKYNLSAPPQF